MLSWLGFGKREVVGRTDVPRDGAQDSALYVDLFGARAVAAPPRKASPVSLDVTDDAEPAAAAVGSAPVAPAATAPAEVAAEPVSPRAELEALLSAKRFAEAEALFGSLPPSFADQDWYLLAGLMLAQRARDQAAVLDFARRLVAMAPASPAAYVAGCFALRLMGRPEEAEALIGQGLAANERAPSLWIEAAQVAEACDQQDLAEGRWQKVRERLPNQPAGWHGGLKLSARLQLHEATHRLATEGLAKFPGDPVLLGHAARSAVRLQLWDEALRHWQALVALSPDDASLALEAVTSLMGARVDRRERLASVLPMLLEVGARFPDHVPAYAVQVTALRHVGRLDEAAALGVTLGARAPGDVALAIARAGVAEEQELMGEAVAILAEARKDRAPDWQLEAAAIRALSLAGEGAAADQVCAAALVAFPGNVRVIEQYVTLATRQGAFAEAWRRADEARRAYPDNEGIGRLARRIAALRDDDTDAGDGRDTAERGALAGMFARFESLGATAVGCEFGIVQRYFGAEPIGLLRWGNMRTEGLTRALRERFAGMGEAANTRMKVQPVAANDFEYFVFDDRYSYHAHTFIKADEAPQDRVYQQTLRRLRFLSGKLIEDLEQAEKIFVFKVHSFDGIAPLEEMFEALLEYGPVTLLCVVLADEAHEGGTVEMLRPGFFVGRVVMFGNAGVTSARGIDRPSWRRICEAVAAWHDGEGARLRGVTRQAALSA